MIKNMMIPVALVLVTGAQAECLSDSWELGDAGPGSSRVCEMLGTKFPAADLAVVDRRIHSADEVSVVVTVNGEPRSLDYRLIGADWVLESPELASRQQPPRASRRR